MSNERMGQLRDEIAAIEKDVKPHANAVTKALTNKKLDEAAREAEAEQAEAPQLELEAKALVLYDELVKLTTRRLNELGEALAGESDEAARKALEKELAGLEKSLEKDRMTAEIYRLRGRYAPLGLFRGLKDMAWEGLVNHRQNRVVPQGDVFVNQGDYTGAFCVVLGGLVSVYREEPGGRPTKLGTLGAGHWFGEMSALANQPAMARVQADTRCDVLAIDPPLFKVLYSQEPFKNRIDRKYRERALAAHLRTAPVLKGISEQKLLPLQKAVDLVVFDEGQVIAKEGDEAQAIFLIRSGSVKCTRLQADGSDRIVSYLMDNSSFGERSLSSENRFLQVTFTALERTDAVQISRDVLERVYAGDTATLETIVATADAILSAEAGRLWGVFDFLSDEGNAGRLTRDKLEIMVSNQSVKGGEALVIDLTKCTRCNACVEACVSVHDDRVPRLSKTGTRISSDKVLTTACYHCETPGCMSKCNDGAIRRDVKGSIHFIWDNCTGCTACITGCPYGVIRMADLQPALDRVGNPYGGPGFVEGIPLVGRFLSRMLPRKAAPSAEEQTDLVKAGIISARTGRENKKRKKAIKCDLCAGLPFEACVYNCPCGAIDRFNPEALFASKS